MSQSDLIFSPLPSLHRHSLYIARWQFNQAHQRLDGNLVFECVGSLRSEARDRSGCFDGKGAGIADSGLDFGLVDTTSAAEMPEMAAMALAKARPFFA